MPAITPTAIGNFILGQGLIYDYNIINIIAPPRGQQDAPRGQQNAPRGQQPDPYYFKYIKYKTKYLELSNKLK